jgi:hypothetical protein
MKVQLRFQTSEFPESSEPVSGETLRVTTPSKGLQRKLDGEVVAEASRYGVSLLTLKNQGQKDQWVFRADECSNQALAAMYIGVPKSRSTAERATYLTSRHLRLNVVPKLLRAEWKGKAGTLQRMVPQEDESFHASVDLESLIATLILQRVTNFYDPREENIVWEQRGETFFARAIDGAFTFGNQEPNTYSAAAKALKLRPGEDIAIPPKLLKRIRSTHIEHWKKDLLREGLTENQVNAAEFVLRKIQQSGRIR